MNDFKFIYLLVLGLFYELAIFPQYVYKSFYPNPPVCNEHGCWVGFLKYKSEYMGPNALPVADALSECVGKISQFETRLISNQASGDNTQNIYMRFSVPVVSDVVHLEVNSIVYEQYEMDTARRIKVSAWQGPGEGKTMGDVNINTVVQIIKGKTFPDMAIRVNLRTTTGYYLSDARYSDAPGFFLDAAFGKSFFFENSAVQQVRPFLSTGFYTYQTNSFKHMQNDATMYNAGVNCYIQKWLFATELAGYYGYEGDGDRPVLFRTNLNYVTSRFNYSVAFQKGLNDYDYTTLYFGITWKLDFSKSLESLRSEN